MATSIVKQVESILKHAATRWLAEALIYGCFAVLILLGLAQTLVSLGVKLDYTVPREQILPLHVAAGVCLGLVFRIRKSLAVGDAESESTTTVVRKLRKRAAESRSLASWILLLTGGAIVCGLIIFTKAGQLADKQSKNAMFAQQVSEATAALQSQAASNAYDTQKESKRSIDRIYFVVQQIRDLASKEAASPGFDAPFVTTLTARVGTVILLLFLTQILVALYRYNTRMAAFYDSRADAFELLQGKQTGLEQLVAVLSPHQVDFSEPKSAAEHALEIVKDAVRAKVGAVVDGDKPDKPDKPEDKPAPKP